ncbi:trehalase family glycosidase [uncultured Kordia sp.]|uniref:MGH1-like glycoside hydrolase domain-containing protein n=1 Tax=uncultured Kordia sp. TaxID=507699 RepID=UPI0026308BFA|nr:trehalase family glycosidase [uncultured Kordia sp.]
MFKKVVLIGFICILIGCESNSIPVKTANYDTYFKATSNVLDFSITPNNTFDKSGLMFSDQGAWFAYSLSDTISVSGFSGPFLMTEQNGVWAGKSLANFTVKDHSWASINSVSYLSHLEQNFKSDTITLSQQLVYLSGHTALIKNTITNTSNVDITIQPQLSGGLFDNGIYFSGNKKTIQINSNKTTATGYIHSLNDITSVTIDSTQYTSSFKALHLKPNEQKSYICSQTFIFPEYSWKDEQKLIQSVNFDSIVKQRLSEKNKQLTTLISLKKELFSGEKYTSLLAKAMLTLQNNWRIPAGEIKHEGLFPSYHYKWFNGFWSWDSWKHAVGLSYFDSELAKKQIKLMFDFQEDDGFVADCVFRDTTIEAHNYRDTKPPLSAWAVSKIYEKDKDLDFINYMYPKLKKYHYWWYAKRDHDQDGLCEYGATDGSLIAAKWESGMDNAIRFDNSKILKNTEGAYSLDQESVDLNAYLYAEKLFLATLAKALQKHKDADTFSAEAEVLKKQIQQQFYDTTDAWFYDTSLEGTTFIKGEGSEGWIPLWAKVATQQQAIGVKNNMMNPAKFYTKVPFQTMSADHPKFNPLKGYWRGPNWLDQAYFGVKGLLNYGFKTEADQASLQILAGCKGLIEKGTSIRENYHPITGEGLNAKNFSWSAAHVMMLLIED